MTRLMPVALVGQTSTDRLRMVTVSHLVSPTLGPNLISTELLDELEHGAAEFATVTWAQETALEVIGQLREAYAEIAVFTEGADMTEPPPDCFRTTAQVWGHLVSLPPGPRLEYLAKLVTAAQHAYGCQHAYTQLRAAEAACPGVTGRAT